MGKWILRSKTVNSTDKKAKKELYKQERKLDKRKGYKSEHTWVEGYAVGKNRRIPRLVLYWYVKK